MEKTSLSTSQDQRSFFPTLRDFSSTIFRHLRLILGTFFGLFLLVVLYAWLAPRQYEAEIKILLNHERVDPLVSTDAEANRRLLNITTQELNSEFEILRSQDLLQKIVVSCGLDEPNPQLQSSWDKLKKSAVALFISPPDKNKRIALAVLALQQKLVMAPLPLTNLIKVTYDSLDPKLAARVLNTLADLYLQKHLAVRRPAGALDFFQQEAERYREGLTRAEERLANFERDNGVASLQLEKELTVKKQSDLEATLQATQAEIATLRERIRALEGQATSTPARMTTQVRTSARLLEQQRATLLTLELKRIELLGIYQSSYPPVQEVEKQIAETRSAIAAAEKVPLLEESTDRDATYEWLRSELAKARAELMGLEARARVTAQAISAYREKAGRLGRMELIQQDLVRNTKLAEQSYMVYFGKKEDARISDALDRQRIMNVAIAEAAIVPVLPSWPPVLLLLMLGGPLAGFLSVGIAFACEYWDPSLRTPDEVEALLNIPVAAAIPKYAR